MRQDACLLQARLPRVYLFNRLRAGREVLTPQLKAHHVNYVTQKYSAALPPAFSKNFMKRQVAES
jgi:hypothetical protein